MPESAAREASGEVERFKLLKVEDETGEEWTLCRRKRGDWVRFEDYASLAERLEEAQRNSFDAWLDRVRESQPESHRLRDSDLDGGDAVERVRQVLKEHLDGLQLGYGMVDLALAQAVEILRPRIERIAAEKAKQQQ